MSDRLDGTPFVKPDEWLVDPGDLIRATTGGEPDSYDDRVVLLADHTRAVYLAALVALELGSRAGRGQLAAIDARDELELFILDRLAADDE